MQGKTVVLTGASGGIGGALAEELASKGARLVLIGRNTEKLSKLAELLGEGHSVVSCDIATADGRETIISYCQALESGVDMLVNNAGIGAFKSFDKTEEEQVISLIHTNLTSTILLTQAMLPILQAQKSSQIVNVGSAFGSIGFPGFVVYSASKFGLRGFTEALARELSDSSVAVRYFAPRATKTPLNDANVDALNAALDTHVDEPSQVAKEFVEFVESNKQRYYVGWPEKLFARINGVFPALVDSSISKQLALIKSCLPK
ncbi:MAG: SDR family oxidoreductase [Cycloclasticus sp.]